MSINISLLGQMITFGLFVWFTMRFVWPPVIKTLQERQARIAEGLAAAERGHRDLALSQESVKKHLKEAKAQCHDLIEAAKKQAQHIVDLGKTQAKELSDRQKLQAQSEIDVLVQQAKETLRSQVVDIAILSAEKILAKKIDDNAHHEMVNALIKGL